MRVFFRAGRPRWWLDPARGLTLSWILVVIVALGTRPQLGIHLLTWPVLAAWLLTLVMGAAIPVPPPLREKSALLARIMWLAKVLWGVILFGAAAVQGASVSYRFEYGAATGDQSDFVMSTLMEPIATFGFAFVWVCVMWVAVDLCRTSKHELMHAATRVVNVCVPGPPFVRTFGWRALVAVNKKSVVLPLAYMAPVILVVLWDAMAGHAEGWL